MLSLSLACVGLFAPPAAAQVRMSNLDPHALEYDVNHRGRHANSPYVTGVDCSAPGLKEWECHFPVPFDEYGHGEYIGPARTPAVMQYRIRVDDLLQFIFRRTQETSGRPYQLEVGDELALDSLVDQTLDRERLVILSDGTISVRLLGRVRAAGQSIDELRDELEKLYREGDFVQEPNLTVTVLKANSKLEALIASVDNRQSDIGGQILETSVNPEGTIALPAIGTVRAHGLSLEELKFEVNQRFAEIADGVEVTPILQERAPRFCYVTGEVVRPSRFELVAPTSVSQSIALAQGYVNGANLTQVVVFRRGDDWRMKATMVSLRPTLQGQRPCPADEIWLRDSDIVVVPKTPIRVTTDLIDLVFTRGIYSVFPIGFNANLTNNTSGI